MKVYQCIRLYDQYIPAFESKYQIKDSNYSFAELRDLLIQDGFASAYILQPAFEGNKEFFFTFWNYERLQFKWAEENGIKGANLDEIKNTQVEEFKPDVFYNLSPSRDGFAIQKILEKKELIKVCWDAKITHNPSLYEKYNLRLTLFEPYVKFWRQHGFDSTLLPPAFPNSWNNLDQTKKDIDLLFYGQYSEHFFSERNQILKELTKWSNQKGYNFKLHLQFSNLRKPLINIRGFRRFTRWMPVASSAIMDKALPPIYGRKLYETIARSKIVVNAFTNYNGMFKDNMRNYEGIGCGAFLISEDGIYPDHFIPGSDFYTYRSSDELFEKIEQILSLPDQGLKMAETTRKKLKLAYSKENQWNAFFNAVNSL